MTNRFKKIVLPLIVSLIPSVAAVGQTPSLKDVYKDDFLIGVAMNRTQIDGKASADIQIIKQQFDAISPENILKWEPINPKPGVYNFGPVDRYVAFGQKNHMFILGHNLVWHKQVPKWIFLDKQGNLVDRDTLLRRMKKHIEKLVGRYKGRINAWDVVNEAVGEDGSLRNTKWLQIIGPDYIAKAFEFTHAADPDAELYYNDFNLDDPAKRNGVIRLVKKLQDEGVHVDGIGMQGHWNLHSPSFKNIDASIEAFSKLGVKVMITELDIGVLPVPPHKDDPPPSIRYSKDPAYNPYADGLPDSVKTALADRYGSLFKVFLKHNDVISRVTFWGLNDKETWKNDWPIINRKDYPLLLDRNNQPKEAFHQIIKIGQESN